MAKQRTCPHCGKRFNEWRAKAYCSENCRKAAQNRRLGYVRRDAGILQPAGSETENKDQQNQHVGDALRRYGGAYWVACNEITDRYARKGADADGWAMHIKGEGWYGRVGKEMAFGPTDRRRAHKAVEAFLMGEPFAKEADERSWRGDCCKLIPGLVL